MTKNVIIFVDANNWYHNIKKYFNPGDVDITKFGEFICKIKDYKLKEIRWYASLPNIEDGERNYYKHMAFLSHLEKKSVKVITRKLQRLSNRELQEKQKIEILTAMTSLGYSSELRRNFPYFILRKRTLMKCFRSYKDVKA